VISASTLVVGPVWPRSAVFVTDLPHPLHQISKHLFTVDTALGLPLVEAVDFDALGGECRKEVAVGVDMIRETMDENQSSLCRRFRGACPCFGVELVPVVRCVPAFLDSHDGNEC